MVAVRQILFHFDSKAKCLYLFLVFMLSYANHLLALAVIKVVKSNYPFKYPESRTAVCFSVNRLRILFLSH